MASMASFRALVALCIFAMLQGSMGWSMPGSYAALSPRQSPNAGGSAVGGTAMTCAEYGRIANMSIIGLNSTYRGAFLRSSPVGTDAASAVLDTQSPKLKSLMFNTQLNAQCGNLTTAAFQGAEANFTRGIVAEFTILPAPGIGVEGETTLIVVIAIVIFMGSILFTME